MSVAHEHQGPWTVEDVLAMPEDPSRRVELVGGQLMMSPAPNLAHQEASFLLASILHRAARAADPRRWKVYEAVNVLLPDGLAIPDLVVVDRTRVDTGAATVHAHDVVLAVEIASASTRVTDRKLKPVLYAAAGIPFYWRVELEPAPRLLAGTLTAGGGGYLEREHLSGVAAAFDEPFPITFDPARLREE
ncbi:Uma2 family endonuclease (plasmid) [Streptomyces sp. BI20]|uniref:Uma2 family endonuclease n=1 Tax=Streptomyces sp. BI20 TaxID=3403460 RepID=UPI003C744F79